MSNIDDLTAAIHAHRLSIRKHEQSIEADERALKRLEEELAKEQAKEQATCPPFREGQVWEGPDGAVLVVRATVCHLCTLRLSDCKVVEYTVPAVGTLVLTYLGRIDDIVTAVNPHLLVGRKCWVRGLAVRHDAALSVSDWCGPVTITAYDKKDNKHPFKVGAGAVPKSYDLSWFAEAKLYVEGEAP